MMFCPSGEMAIVGRPPLLEACSYGRTNEKRAIAVGEFGRRFHTITAAANAATTAVLEMIAASCHRGMRATAESADFTPRDSARIVSISTRTSAAACHRFLG